MPTTRSRKTILKNLLKKINELKNIKKFNNYIYEKLI